MKIYFLQAEIPIRKRYEKDANGNLIKHSYPNVYEVTSTEESVATIEDFARHITQHAANGETLVKGILARPLRTETRAGATSSDEKTEWICLDLDGISNYQSVDIFLHSVGLGDVDYVLQWSSSMSIENNQGFRCHIFMLLDQPTHPAILKNWLMHKNLVVPTIAQQIELTKTANALRWPLDVTTCQNDKLLYIAPPELGPGVTDPYPLSGIEQRITLHKRINRLAKLPYPIPSKEAIRQLAQDKINELRKAANLPKRRRIEYKYTGGTEYVTNPDTAIVTGLKHERGFTYLNLNGGDSWAYYHADEAPAFIHNFKGEPSYRTQDLLPEYWAKIATSQASIKVSQSGKTFLAFRDFRSSLYYNGTFDPNNKTLDLAIAKSETQLRHFMAQNGQTIGEYIPDWNITFNPQSADIIDTGNRTINTFRPSRFMAEEQKPKLRNSMVPSTIFKVMSHVVGNDAVALERLINWIACIVQFRDKNGTAWILHGTEGTGKGLLFHKILTPILGESNTSMKRMEELEGNFNGYMKDTMLVAIDEMETGRSLYHAKIASKLKNFITEEWISIREMYRMAYDARNYTNMMFFSNKGSVIHIPAEDRRFNVGTFQTEKLDITQAEIDKIDDELQAFYDYLVAFPADRQLARTPLVNEARAKAINISTTALDSVINAITSGDLEFLWEQLPDKSSEGAMDFEVRGRYTAYRALVLDILDNMPNTLSRDDIHTLANWTVGDMPSSPHKFASLLKHHKIELESVWRNGRTSRGIKIAQWKCGPTFVQTAKNAVAAGLV